MYHLSHTTHSSVNLLSDAKVTHPGAAAAIASAADPVTAVAATAPTAKERGRFSTYRTFIKTVVTTQKLFLSSFIVSSNMTPKYLYQRKKKEKKNKYKVRVRMMNKPIIILNVCILILDFYVLFILVLFSPLILMI